MLVTCKYGIHSKKKKSILFVGLHRSCFDAFTAFIEFEWNIDKFITYLSGIMKFIIDLF